MDARWFAGYWAHRDANTSKIPREKPLILMKAVQNPVQCSLIRRLPTPTCAA